MKKLEKKNGIGQGPWTSHFMFV